MRRLGTRLSNILVLVYIAILLVFLVWAVLYGISFA